MDVSFLPHVNAALNATSGVLLSLGYYFIRTGQRETHRKCMLGALTSSALFLVSYLTYHFNYGATTFKGPATARIVYLTILATHTVLAVVIVPLVLITVSRALHAKFPQHRKIARWTFPLWLYVSVTGVVVYALLYHVYPSR